jgi:hypothetical protein
VTSSSEIYDNIMVRFQENIHSRVQLHIQIRKPAHTGIRQILIVRSDAILLKMHPVGHTPAISGDKIQRSVNQFFNPSWITQKTVMKN